MSVARTTACVLAAAAFVSACGHKGPPIAPRRRTPPSLGDFRIAQRGQVIEVSLTAPRASVDGVAYERLDIEIFWGPGQVDLEKAGQQKTVRATPGSRVVQTLPLPAPGTLVRVAARAVAGGNRGQRTLIQALEAQAPLEAPHDLTAHLREMGVTLNWRGQKPDRVAPPERAPTGRRRRLPFGGGRAAQTPSGKIKAPGAAPQTEAAGQPGADEPPGRAADTEASGAAVAAAPGQLAAAVSEAADDEEGAVDSTAPSHGFRVYRRVPPGVYGVPLNYEPQERRILTDQAAPLGSTACYVVRAVGSVEPLIESAPSNEACLEVRDIIAPSPPTGLAVVPRAAGLEIVWSPSAEGDLGGYRIYRAVGERKPVQVGEVEAGTTTWLDASADSVVLYRYTITAVDQAGNEGPPSGSAEGRRP